jgi:predicted AAA+ superfamily ATPase
LKLYINDVGILSGIFYRNNINAIMSDINSVNLGSIYETVVAQELKAHGYNLYYYDNKKNGEVDFLIDDVDNLSNIPIEVKSGKQYKTTSLNNFREKYKNRIGESYIIHPKNLIIKDGIICSPPYMTMML